MTYSTGYRRDRADHGLPAWHRSPRMQAGLRGRAIPLSASVAQWTPPVLDQGPTGSCIGHGTANAIWTACQAAGRPLPFFPSPRAIYAGARQVERARHFPPGRILPDLEDTGAMPSDAITALEEIGIGEMRGPTDDGRRSDCDAGNVNADLRLPDLVECDAHRIVGPYRISYGGPSLTNALLVSLSQGAPVGIGVFADAAFMAWAGGEPLSGKANLNDPNGGGHWVMVEAVETLSSGHRVITLLNSWGEGYGENGRIRVTEEWLLSCASDPTAFVVEEAA